ncbi:Tnks [Symbiodinium sp. CCMP2456]|nr:Tnks [Symbiodinium sp. CCMP2456]
MVPGESALFRARRPQRCTLRRSKGLLLARPAVASVFLASALFLQGCGEPETCYPDGTAERAWYNCHSNVYCSLQGDATRLGSMSLADCMTQCETRDCSVIQYDCGTDCWLLDSCGPHVTSGCESSIYYRDRNWGTTTTTEATTQAQTQTGECVAVTALYDYACSPRKYCANQGAATLLGEIPLEECLSRCDDTFACTSVQWDCGVSCWLMEAEPCGDELDTVCGSSLYHKIIYPAPTTRTTNATTNTTTTTTTTTTSARFILHTEGLTNCPSNATPVLNESGCREAATALGYILANTEDTNQWPNGCYKWTRQPELYFNLNAGSGNVEAQVVCETMGISTTTTTTTLANATTSSAATLSFSLLSPGLTSCPSNSEPVLSEFDCREAARSLGYTFANAEDTDQWPNGCYKWLLAPELFFNLNAGSGNPNAQVVCQEGTSTAPTTTSSVQPGSCIVTSAEYTCTPRKFCELQSEAQQLGPMSLEGCKVACSQTDDCNAIQYDCNTDCWLLRACGGFVDTVCGSSVYIRDRNWLWGTTTTTTVFGQCYPSTTPDAMPYLDSQWGCTPAVYCSEQASSATRYGAMSLDRCMALCRAVGCNFVQFDCNSDCWLMDACGTFETSTCGSSVYQKFGTAPPYFAMSDVGPYRSDRFSASLYVTYSSACSGDDCTVAAVCPISPSSNLQTTVLKCQTIPPDSGDGISVTESNCTAKGGGELPAIMAEAICVESDSLSSLVTTSGYGEGDLRATCPDGYYAFSCNCFTSWLVSETCAGYASFAPRMSPPIWGNPWTGTDGSDAMAWHAMAELLSLGLEPQLVQSAQPYWGSAECQLYSPPEVVSHRRRGVGRVQAQLSALCVRGAQPTVRLSYRGEGDRWPLPNSTGKETQYCGWATNTKVTILRTECNPWMEAPSSDGGCSNSECFDLASCVRICNSCGFCKGVFYSFDHLSSSSLQRCYFTGDFEVENGESDEWNYGWGQSPNKSLNVPQSGSLREGTTSAAWALYINTRDARCRRDDYAIYGVTFFEDPHCTKIMAPSSMNVSGGGQTELPVDFGDWRKRLQNISFDECYEEMQAGRKCDVEFTAAFPPNSSAPLCAIVHSSWLFGQGYSSDSGESRGWYLAAYDQQLGRVRHGTVAFDVDGTHIHMPAMQWFRQNVSEPQPGATIVLSSWIEFGCWYNVAPCPNDVNFPVDMFPPIEQHIREALASMLALPQHLISVREGEFGPWVPADTRVYGYNVTIHLAVEDPVQASLLPSLVATLEDMRRNFYDLSDAFKTRLRYNGVRLFDTAQIMRDTVVFWIPPATKTAFPTTPSPSPSPSPTPAPSPPEVPVEAYEDDPTPAIIVSSIAGAAILGGAIVIFCCQARRRNCFGRRKAKPSYAGGPTAVVIGSKATLRSDSKELVDPLNEMAMKSLPSYWTGGRESGEESNVREDLAFDELLYVKHEHMEFFQELVNHTYRQITTQDRLCPTGKHDKTRGGCPCVQPGGTPGLPTGYQIKRVIRVEDSSMFTRYIDRREQIKNSRSSCEAPDPKIFTRAAMEASSGLTDILCDVDDSINEVYLWHGTQVRTGLKIAQDDFSLNYAGSGAGTMYGKGLYFTESCTKADEYALDEPGGHYDSARGLLLCRVCLGSFHYTLDREPSAIDKYRNGECDSTIGDRAKAVNTYREMVVYDRDQVYPEYLVLYERLQRGETPELPPKDVPFLLELPLYWKNVGRNPYTEGFREHWIVKPMIRQLIQRLANGSCGRDGGAPKVVRARRVEDSNLWCRYIDWKRSLGAQLQANGDLKCTPPNELDGNPESGHALTATILAEFHGDEAISVENMAPGLNEMLLWHGTSQKSAEAISEEGFEVKKSGTHGRRFGHGVYLAEDLNKSLSYCTAANNVKYVLLCRAVCGHMYYTEKHWHSDATSEATARGKHCVLANPDRSGPREYIVLQESHVYPEYIVEFED